MIETCKLQEIKSLLLISSISYNHLLSCHFHFFFLLTLKPSLQIHVFPRNSRTKMDATGLAAIRTQVSIFIILCADNIYAICMFRNYPQDKIDNHSLTFSQMTANSTLFLFHFQNIVFIFIPRSFQQFRLPFFPY